MVKDLWIKIRFWFIAFTLPGLVLIFVSGSYYPAVGIASRYSNKFAGRKTASGEIYNPEKLTAAHRAFPLGTKVNVTNLANGRRVMVKINDRGPYIRGRIIDLSYAAARQLDMLKEGIARVRVDAVR